MVNIDLQKKVMYNVFMEQRNYPVYTFELIKNFPYSILLDVAYTEVHSHIFWELVYCLKGESLNTINGTAHKITRGKALIIRPQDVHGNRLKRGPYTHRDIYVSAERMKKVCGMIEEGLYERLLTAEETPMFELSEIHIESIESSFKIFDNVRTPDHTYDMIHETLIARFLGLYFESLMPAKTHQPQWLSNMLADINKNPVEYSLEELIAKTNYSHGHICREFKKYLGVSLKKNLITAKLSFSTSLLYNCDMSIAEISQRLGYSNQSNYVNEFKKYYRIAPSRYRKLHTSKIND